MGRSRRGKGGHEGGQRAQQSTAGQQVSPQVGESAASSQPIQQVRITGSAPKNAQFAGQSGPGRSGGAKVAGHRAHRSQRGEDDGGQTDEVGDVGDVPRDADAEPRSDAPLPTTSEPPKFAPPVIAGPTVVDPSPTTASVEPVPDGVSASPAAPSGDQRSGPLDIDFSGVFDLLPPLPALDLPVEPWLVPDPGREGLPMVLFVAIVAFAAAFTVGDRRDPKLAESEITGRSWPR